MNEIKLKLKNKNEFLKFLKNFQGISENLLIELLINDKIISKAINGDERSLVKRHSRDFDTMFETDSQETKLIFIGIYQVEKFLKVLNIISDNSTITLKHIEKKGKKANTNTNTIDISTIEITDGSLTFDIDCAEFKLFTYLDDEKFSNVVANTADNDIEFSFKYDLRKNINDYSDVEIDDQITILYNGNDTLKFNGKTWKYDFKIADLKTTLEGKEKYNLKKSLFRKLSNYDYDVFIKKNKSIFINFENEEIIVISHTIEEDV